MSSMTSGGSQPPSPTEDQQRSEPHTSPPENPSAQGAANHNELTDEQRQGLQVARHLIVHGVPVFIARPAMEDGVWNPHGGHDGTGYVFPTGWEHTVPDPRVLDRWRPGDALCAVMGHTVDGVDIDPYHGGDKSEAELEAADGWPRSYGRQATPSGGWHYLISPLGIGSPRDVMDGVDLRGGRADGSGRGFLFIAPTVKISKVTGDLESYRWSVVPHLDDLDPQDDSGGQLAQKTKRSSSRTDSDPVAPEVRRFTEMSRAERTRAKLYLDAAVDGMRDELAQAATWPEGYTQTVIHLSDGSTVEKSPRGWQKLLADVCQRLGKLARAEWNDWTIEDAREALSEIVPQAIADAVPVEETWRKQYDRGAPADPPSTGAREPSLTTGGGGGLEVITASEVVRRRVRYLWAGFIPVGALTLMPGEEGIGKTTVGMRIIADLTQGTLPGEFLGTPRDALVLAPEDGIAEVLAPRLMEAGADMDRVHFVTMRRGLDGSPLPVEIPRDLHLLADVVRDHEVGLVWIDSLVTTLPDEMSSISYKDTAKVLRLINVWAEERQVSVVAPWHLNKASGTDTATRIMDSRAFRTGVRSMVLVVRDPDAPEGSNQGLVVLDKANAGRLDIAGLRYRIRPARYFVDELDPATGEMVRVTGECGVVDWLGEVEGDALLLARQSLSPKMEKDDGARGWLRDYLEDMGEVSRGDIMVAGRQEGYSESSIKRAARVLGVKSNQVTGQTDGVPHRHASWSLPSPATGEQQARHTHNSGPTDPSGEE